MKTFQTLMHGAIKSFSNCPISQFLWFQQNPVCAACHAAAFCKCMSLILGQVRITKGPPSIKYSNSEMCCYLEQGEVIEILGGGWCGIPENCLASFSHISNSSFQVSCENGPNRNGYTVRQQERPIKSTSCDSCARSSRLIFYIISHAR